MTPNQNQIRVEIHEELTKWKKDRVMNDLTKLSEWRRTVDSGKKYEGGLSITASEMPGRYIWVIGGVTDVKAYVEEIDFARVVEFREEERTVVLSVRK